MPYARGGHGGHGGHGGLCPVVPHMRARKAIYSGSQKSEVCPMPTEAYALCPMPYAHSYLIFLRKAIYHRTVAG
jgi:hypothetical protein